MKEEKKAVITKDNYDELKKMLSSDDKASVNLAMITLEQADYKKSEVFILCLLKECYSEITNTFKNAGNKDVESQFEELFNNIKSNLSAYNTDLVTLSFETIFKITRSRKNQFELEFILEIFSNELKEILKEFSFEFLNYLDLHLVVKDTPIKILYDEKEFAESK